MERCSSPPSCVDGIIGIRPLPTWLPYLQTTETSLRFLLNTNAAHQVSSPASRFWRWGKIRNLLTHLFASSATRLRVSEHAYPNEEQRVDWRGFADKLHSYVIANRHALGEIVRARPVNTNDPERSTALYLGTEAAIHWMAADASRPEVDLLEIGCSAAVNLFFDRYWHRPRPHEGRVFDWGSKESRVVLDTNWMAAQPRHAPSELHVIQRRGLDQRPPNLDDPLERRWLKASLFNGSVSMENRLDGAIDIVRGEHPTIVRGDITQHLGAQLDSMNADALRVVWASHVLTYMSEGEIDHVFSEITSRPNVALVSMEPIRILPFLESQLPPMKSPEQWSILAMHRAGAAGELESHALALVTHDGAHILPISARLIPQDHGNFLQILRRQEPTWTALQNEADSGELPLL